MKCIGPIRGLFIASVKSLFYCLSLNILHVLPLIERRQEEMHSSEIDSHVAFNMTSVKTMYQWQPNKPLHDKMVDLDPESFYVLNG